ncbi:endonuclease [Nocardioides mesophilus]|uniref:Endonuclease n=1 Tax=Nocardioides mesophilus TaxID=433659 RepID=A0A7G9R9W8_9ACTN|nr:endonuclease [Nocardioides mesophilus]QNN52393.1 endonuclease [Nocardioides mesophilus]
MDPKADVRRLLEEHGTTYAAAAGIKLTDKPAPLFRLLVLTMLSSTRISAGIATEAARQLFAQGWRTPERMLASSWQQRVRALGAAGYRRYDESTATQLENLSRHLQEGYDGDLRRARPSRARGADALIEEIGSFPRIGPIGARIFCREVQAVWPEVRPFFDDRALETAQRLGLPTDPVTLAGLVPEDRVAELAAALARAHLAADPT